VKCDAAAQYQSLVMKYTAEQFPELVVRKWLQSTEKKQIASKRGSRTPIGDAKPMSLPSKEGAPV